LSETTVFFVALTKTIVMHSGPAYWAPI